MPNNAPTTDDALLTAGEVARLFRVNRKTVSKWAKTGKLAAMRTIGGQYRFSENEVRSVLVGRATTSTAGHHIG